MKIFLKILTLLVITLSAAVSRDWKEQDKTIIPVSRTVFKVVDKNGSEEIVDLTGKKIILVSVSEPGSEGMAYSIDKGGTIWWTSKISSGAYDGHETPTGIYPIILKRRYHMSKTHPSDDGINNMDYEMLFTQDGMALHLGNPKMLSHGCIHVGQDDVETMYNWSDTKTKVVIMRGDYKQFLQQEINDFQKSLDAYNKKKSK